MISLEINYPRVPVVELYEVNMTERRRYKKRCLYCNSQFYTTHKEARFCSKKCGSLSHKTSDINIWSEGLNDINTYIIGLIASDGCIYLDKKQNRNMLNITSKDYKLIEYLNNLMTPSKKIYENKGSFSIIYKNDEALNYIISLGISYRKSLTLKFPYIPDEFFWSFMRGYFDGDGCIYKSHNNGHDYMFVSITSGSLDILMTIQDKLLKYDIHARINKDCRKDTFYLKIYKQKDVSIFAENMYKNAQLFLGRKRERFNIFLGPLYFHYSSIKMYSNLYRKI